MAEVTWKQQSVYLFALLLVSSLYQFGCSQEPCSPGPGFVEGLPSSPDSGSIDNNTYLSGNFIFPQFFFPCSGMITSMRMSIILCEDHFYNETLTMDIILWRQSGSKFVQPQKAQHTATLKITSFISNISIEYTVIATREKFHYLQSRVERSITVVRSARPINVTAGDIMGVSLPANSLYIIISDNSTVSVINGIHTSLQDSNRSAIIREVADCRDQTTGVLDCYTVYPDVKPLIEVEFVPGSSQAAGMITATSTVSTAGDICTQSNASPSPTTTESLPFGLSVGLAVVLTQIEATVLTVVVTVLVMYCCCKTVRVKKTRTLEVEQREETGPVYEETNIHNNEDDVKMQPSPAYGRIGPVYEETIIH